MRGKLLILPAVILPGSEMSLRTDMAVTDFPHPDSPTMPSVLPRSIWNDTSSTA